MAEKVLNLGADANQEPAFVKRAADPVISPAYAIPGDFTAQYPQPLDTTELLNMCEEVNVYREIPTKQTALKAEHWREMDYLQFTSGSASIAFGDGLCPEEYEHGGDNFTVTLKNIGAKKSLSLSDIKHSIAVASMGQGISALAGAFPSSEGMPGGSDMGTISKVAVAGLKAKEMQLASTLVLNGWDKLLVSGNATTNTLAFDGIENLVGSGTGAHYDHSNISGTFSSASFDRFLTEGCAKPSAVFGHPQAIQEMMTSYFANGGVAVQNVAKGDGNRLTPGFNFAGEVFTGAGTMKVVADSNFARTDVGDGTFQAHLYALRMSHNGDPLVYKANQFDLAFQDLTPGCTAISFQIWAKSALVIKAKCAQGDYLSGFTGRIQSTCSVLGFN